MDELTPTYPHPWCKRVAAYLPDALFIKPLSEQDVRWRRVQQLLSPPGMAPSEAAVDDAIQGCLTLLEHHTKDMRVLAALLHCQWGRQTPDAFIVGLQLLATWMDCAWQRAHPMSTTQKAQLLTTLLEDAQACARQVLPVCQGAQHQQAVAAVEGVVRRLRQWLPERTALAADLQQVLAGPSSPGSAPPLTLVSPAPAAMPLAEEAPPEAGCLPWRETLLGLSHRLMSDAPDEPVGYLLRRHAMWSSLSVTLRRGEETALAPPSAQHIRTGMACLNAPTLALWHDFELLLESAPCWFDGQRLSAAIALALGYGRVSAALHEATLACLTAHPQWRTLTFDDGSPFLSARTHAWLAQPVRDAAVLPVTQPDVAPAAPQVGVSTLARDDVQTMMQQAEAWRLAGRHQEAAQRYRWLLHHVRQRGLASWEPQLMAQLSAGLVTCMTQGDASSA